jgi:hypothetical protein
MGSKRDSVMNADRHVSGAAKPEVQAMECWEGEGVSGHRDAPSDIPPGYARQQVTIALHLEWDPSFRSADEAGLAG